MNYSKINQLKENQKNVYLEICEVIECSEPKEININGKLVQVVDAVIQDNTGKIRISAFGFMSKFLLNAKKIKVENCYCRLYGGEDKKEGELCISTGYFGRIKRIELIKEENEK